MENYLVLIFSRVCLCLSFAFHVWITISPFTKSTIYSVPEGRLVTGLIHRDSIFSPVYSKDSTVSDRANFALKSSAERHASLKAKADSAFVPYLAGTLLPNSASTVFFLNVSVGEPPVQQLLTFDTGSGLLWVQCRPCPSCRRTKEPSYNPRKSSSYAPLTCYPKECADTFQGHCDSNGYCEYSIPHRDGANSTGTIAFENFIFHTYNRGSGVATSMIFGCGSKNNDRIYQSNGVIGLNAAKASPLSSIGHKFSYCLGSIRDPLYPDNFLIMGDGAILDGNFTPFQIRNDLYYVTLESVTVNGKKLIANPKDFRFNVIFDSGTTITYLAKSLFDPLIEGVKAALSRYRLRPVPFRNYPHLLCFLGEMESDLLNLPIVLHFPGFDMELNRETLFFQAQADAFCLAIDTRNDGWNIIGVINQQFSNIGYDLEAKKMSYRDADCQFVAKSF